MDKPLKGTPLHVPPTSLQIIQANLQALRKHDIRATSIDDFKQMIMTLANTVLTQVQTIKVGTRVFRGRDFSPDTFPSHVSELNARPPLQVRTQQRCNRAGTSIFYCAANTSTVFHELRKRPGERIILSEWEVIHPLKAATVGYAPDVFTRLKASRSLPKVWRLEDFPFPDYRAETALLNSAYSDLFTQLVEAGSEDDYNLTIAISEFLLHESPEQKQGLNRSNVADAIAYPTVQGRAESDNLAIRYETAQTNLKFVRARELELTHSAKESAKVRCKSHRRTEGCRDDGVLRWHSDPPFDVTAMTSTVCRFGFRFTDLHSFFWSYKKYSL